VPYRIDIPRARVERAKNDTFDRVVELGALDAEISPDGAIAALFPDSVSPEEVARALGVDDLSVSPAIGRDEGSVWILGPRPVRVGRLRIVPADVNAEPGAIKLIDAAAFGTGLHPTTALCLDAIDDAVRIAPLDTMLDVGTGSGVLALAALMFGVPRVMAIDTDDEALRVVAENARLNGLESRVQLHRGGPDSIAGTWPLVVANILAAPLIEMAPALAQRVSHHGELVLSGIPSSVEQDVDRAYRRLGMQRVRVTSRAGWVALVLRASW
jgi:ribosomal protein L11 methyltransferase